VLVQVMASIIVPSDEETPGLEEVCVLGPPAVVTLDGLVATSTYRQQLYSKGLLAFDVWALNRRGCKFAEMSKEDQILLLRAAEQGYEDWTKGSSALTKAWQRLKAITRAKNGSIFAAELFPQFRDDCMQVFYTSRVSWVWLEYDGPPMEKGYSSVTEPR
jgi:hypothetical protein